MENQKVMNRWLVVVGALLIQVSLGAIYIYSVFKPGLKGVFPQWSATDLALPSQLVLAFFALSMIFFGRIQDKVGPRSVATLGGIILGAGLIVARFATGLSTFVLGFSILGGIGIGAAYVCPIATCVKWFPDKRGLITGLAVAGFGAGGLVFTPVAKSLIAAQGVMNTFMYLGVIFLIAVVIGAQLMRNPPAGWKPAGWNPPAPAPGAAALRTEYTWQQMLGTPQFWLLWLTYFAGCTAGLMVIMNTTNVWLSFPLLEVARTTAVVPKATYDGIVSAGATAVIVVAILNAAGRIAWGRISDSIGRKKTLLIMFLAAGVAMLALNWLSRYPLYLMGVGAVGFTFGGFLALFPAVTADYFGTKNVGANYGWMFSAYGAGGLFGPWLAPKLMTVAQKVCYEGIDKAGNLVQQYCDAGSYLRAFVISGVLCFAAAGVILLVKPVKHAAGPAASQAR
jgi:OFA family oxalate/formate antiporter-like MFS transporter